MADAGKRTVLVYGGTGLQGGSVVASLLKDGNFAVRVATRDPDSSKAKALAAQGVEVVKADQFNPEQTAAAMKGVYAVYLVTNFWDETVMTREQELATRLVKQAKEAGVTHLIWSTLPDAEEISNGLYNVPHFTLKAKVDSVVKEAGFKYHTFVVACFYFQNFEMFQLAEDRPDGSMSFNFRIGTFDDDSYLTAYDATETGPAVVAALNHPEEWGSGQKLAYAATHAPVKEFLETFTKVTGRPAELNNWPAERTMGKEEFGAMFSFFNDFKFLGNLDGSTAAKAGGPLTTWEEYLKKTGYGATKPLEY